MKRIIALLLTLVMLAGFAACDRKHAGRKPRDDNPVETESKVSIDRLKSYDGPMLVITSTIQAPIPDDVERESSLILYYDGSLCYPGYPNECLGMLTDEDYMTVYSFCVETVRNDTFADYYEEVCDGQTYRFLYYDEEGVEHVLYDGYIYQNDELNSILDIVHGS